MSPKNVDAQWNVQKILNWTTQHFESKKIESPRVDAEVLLAHVLGCKRLDLYLKFDQPVLESERTRFRELVQRRTTFEPVAYILGEKEFYGRPFKVGPGVLIPRPETEHIIDEALSWAKDKEQSLEILDVATGSGILAATLTLEIKGAKVTALDVSQKALEYARQNFSGEIICQDFISWASQNKRQFDIIVSNPPYISNKAELMKDVKEFEPSLALYGGEGGSEILLQWLPVMRDQLKSGGILLCEMGYDQKKIMEESLPIQGFSLSFIKDYSGHDRIIKITKA